MTKFDTDVIHKGLTPCPTTGAIMPAIYTTSTYIQKSPGEHTGYEYSRTKNPTRSQYEEAIAALEQGSHGFAFASGMAAISTIVDLLPQNSHIIAMNDLYGGTFRLFDKVRKKTSGLSVTYIDMSDESALEAALQENTRMVWAETPSNPLLKLVDIKKVADFAKQHQLLSVIDNTFATPYLQQPLTLGADIVVHSATKYLNGHSDVINGVAVVNNDKLAEDLAFIQNSVGAVASPFDSYIVLRSLKTLSVRMERHCQNALALAKWLSEHEKIEHVIYPGLESHPQQSLAKAQMKAFGGMISVNLKGNLESTLRFLENTKLFSLAESLGGVESLIEHPAIMTHAAVDKAHREAIGINDTLVRLSVGIEHIDDLKNDLNEALSCS